VKEFDGSINMSSSFKGTGQEIDLIFVDMHGLIWEFKFQRLLLQEKLFFTFLVVGANPTPLNNN